jgi:putative hydroxymethylpyrimidine transport system substrate-binding protein
MRRVAALLATVLVSASIAGCGDGGAEPGALRSATLVLDFQPNAVHAGIYAALADGYYADRGIDLDVQEPSASTDAPKLLIAGRADFAILDIHDLGLARERGLKLVGMMPIVQRPLAAVIAANRNEVQRPTDLTGSTVGVTGLPSDDAVLDSVLDADGASPDSVRRVTIGFAAISSLAGGRVAAATAFWNAEGVTLRRQGIPIREFRVDDYGAPRYPELVLATSRRLLSRDPSLARRVVQATTRGYALASEEPALALDDLLAANRSLDRDEQAAELRALESSRAFQPVGRFDRDALAGWARWDVEHGILDKAIDVSHAFPPGGALSERR